MDTNTHTPAQTHTVVLLCSIECEERGDVQVSNNQLLQAQQHVQQGSPTSSLFGIYMCIDMEYILTCVRARTLTCVCVCTHVYRDVYIYIFCFPNNDRNGEHLFIYPCVRVCVRVY